MAREDNQINVRLSSERYEALESAAFVEGPGVTPGALVRAHVEAYADRVAKEPAVRAAIDARRQRAAERAAEITPIRGRNRLGESGET